jgi:U3 small nucleolar RNA-associated protein 12
VLSLRYNYAKAANKLLLCVGLLDSTIKVFFEDSLKFFLSLYGHSLPVLSMDVSDDTRILASGSADKTIKLWGLDFGDCHRSLSGHADSVTSIRFQPHTHYFFSASKDGAVKYWDADRFEQILSLPGHKGPVWGLDLPQDASYCVSVGQDRSLRVWRRGEDLVFVEEEKERALEALADRAAGDDGYGKNKPSKGEEGNNNDGVDKDVVVYEDATAAANAVGSRSVDSVRGGEAIMEALDVAEAELADIAEYEAVLARTKNNMKKRTVNPVLLGATPHMYMITQLRRVKQPDLEQALLIIPFDYVVRMVRMLIALSKLGLDLELCCRASVFLLRCHFPQITSSRVLVPEILELRDLIRENVGSFRDLIGTNLAAVKHIKRSVADKAEDFATIPSPDPEAESSNKRRR